MATLVYFSMERKWALRSVCVGEAKLGHENLFLEIKQLFLPRSPLLPLLKSFLLVHYYY